MSANNRASRLRRLVAELLTETDGWSAPAPLQSHEKVRQLNKSDLRTVIYMMTGTAARAGAGRSREVTREMEKEEPA